MQAAHAYDVLHCVATYQAGPSKPATNATDITDAGQGRISLPIRFQHDETLSGPDLLQKLQALQAENLDVKGDIRCDNYLDRFDEDGALGQDAVFDEIWDACSGVANTESIEGGQHIVESRIALFNGYVDPKNPAPALSLNATGTRELMGLDHRPASVCSDPFHAHASLGEQNLPTNTKTVSFSNL